MSEPSKPGISRSGRTAATCLRGALLLGSLTAFSPAPGAYAQLAHHGPAQSIALAATLPGYDVVSIRENNTGDQSWTMNTHEDRFRAVNVPLSVLIEFAYDAKSDLIHGLTGPVSSLHFDLEAKVLPSDNGAPPKFTDTQLQAMVIRLLADRFHLKAHVEPMLQPVYNLVVARGGPKVHLDQGEHTGSGWNINGGGTEVVLTGKTDSMADLADVLSDEVHRQVVDKTGLTGFSDMTLRWTPDEAADQGAPALSIFTALQEQLGLKLEAAKGPVSTLVVDHAELPSSN